MRKWHSWFKEAAYAPLHQSVPLTSRERRTPPHFSVLTGSACNVLLLKKCIEAAEVLSPDWSTDPWMPGFDWYVVADGGSFCHSSDCNVEKVFNSLWTSTVFGIWNLLSPDMISQTSCLLWVLWADGTGQEGLPSLWLFSCLLEKRPTVRVGAHSMSTSCLSGRGWSLGVIRN